MFLINLIVGLSTLFCVGMNDPAKNPGYYRDLVFQVNPDCYYNWAIYSEDNLKDQKFDPMLWKVTDGAINQAVRLAKQYPGRTWLVYNEPEGQDQANTNAIDGAKWFDKAYEAIKTADPTATIACCGVMIRNEGIDWLNVFIKNAKHLPDVWHIHVFVNQNDFKVWKQFIDYWWNWNSSNGLNKPTFVTETCGMYATAQEDLMIGVIQYKHPLLKRVYWFSAYPEPIVKDWYCNLLNSDNELAGLGATFQARNDFLPNKLTPQPEPPTPTKTPSPTYTPTKEPEVTKTPIPTATLDPDETTNLPNDDEPTIYIYQEFLPVISK